MAKSKRVDGEVLSLAQCLQLDKEVCVCVDGAGVLTCCFYIPYVRIPLSLHT